MRRSKISLTPTLCQRTKPESTKVTLWDADVMGLCLVITPAGTRTWWFVPRRAGKQIWVKIGEYQKSRSDDEKDKGLVWTVEAAREEGAQLRKLHDQGKDVRALARERRAPRNLAELAASYMDSKAFLDLAQRSRQTYSGYIKNHIVPALGTRLVEDLEYADIVAMEKAIAGKGIAVTAGNCVGFVGQLLDYACDLGWRKRGQNPCRGVAITSSEDRTRVFTADEYARLEAALGEGAKADIMRLLAVSGLRIGETAALPIAGVNLETGVLTITEHKGKKSMKVKVLPINTAMAEIFRRQARTISPWVFPGLKGGHRRTAALNKYWNGVVEAADLVDVIPHDLRRSFQTTGVELGYPPADMDVLVGHKLPGMQATYIHLGPGGILAQASATTSAWILAALNGKQPRVGVRVGAEEKKKKA